MVPTVVLASGFLVTELSEMPFLNQTLSEHGRRENCFIFFFVVYFLLLLCMYVYKGGQSTAFM